jgi:hypothetical protein
MPSQSRCAARAVSLTAAAFVLVACNEPVGLAAPRSEPAQQASAALTTDRTTSFDIALDDAIERVAAALGDGAEAAAVRASLVAVRMSAARDRDALLDRARDALSRLPNDVATDAERDVLTLTIDAISK